MNIMKFLFLIGIISFLQSEIVYEEKNSILDDNNILK